MTSTAVSVYMETNTRIHLTTTTSLRVPSIAAVAPCDVVCLVPSTDLKVSVSSDLIDARDTAALLDDRPAPSSPAPSSPVPSSPALDDAPSVAPHADVSPEHAPPADTSAVPGPDLSLLHAQDPNLARLLVAWRLGRVDEKATRSAQRAYDDLYAMFSPVIRQQVSLFSRGSTRVEFEDLLQESSVALMGAASDYDPSRPATFSSYLVTRVRYLLISRLRATRVMPLLSKPEHFLLKKHYNTLSRRYAARTGDFVDGPDLHAYIADELGISIDYVAGYLELVRNPTLSPMSLDEPVATISGDSASALIEAIQDPSLPDPVEKIAERQVADNISSLLKAVLTPREAQVIMLRYLRDEPYLRHEIGSVIGGVSRERARQIEVKALTKMKKFLSLSDIQSTSDFLHAIRNPPSR